MKSAGEESVMKISQFSIKRPVFTIVTMFLVIILGLVSFGRIPVTLIPELNPPVAVVVTNYEGASPTEVNEKLTKPLEKTLATSPDLKKMQSISQEGSNFILLFFDWETVIDDVQLDIMQRMDSVPIPEGADRPNLMKFDPSQFPVIQFTLHSTKEDVDVRPLAEQLEEELKRTKGVASVNTSGTVTEEIQVTLNEEKLNEWKLAQTDVVQAIQGNDVSLPGEPVETDEGKRFTTRIISNLTTLDDIRSVVVGNNPTTGDKIKVSDVASVEVAETNTQMKTRANDEQAVLMSVLQESGANTANVSTEFKKSLDKLLDKKEYKDVKADILFDQGDYVKLAIGNIGQSLLLGGLFAMLVLFFFLRGIKSPIIIGIAIPYSVIVTFVLIYFADFALNIMTLGALALGIGMLVDNAIVVIENIERHLAMNKDPKTAAYEGAKEVGGAITASTLTTLAVFVPVIFISGLIGQIFTEFALTISFSLFASLVVALTVVPMMASKMLKKPSKDVSARLRRSKGLYNFTQSVRWALKNRWAVLTITVGLLGASAFGLYKVGTEFLPATDEGFFSIAVETPNGTALNRTDEVVKKIEKRLDEEDDVEVYVSLVGSDQQSMAQGTGSTANTAEMYIKLVPLDDRDRSVFEFVDEVQPDVLDLVGDDADISFDMQTAAGSTPNTVSFTLSDGKEQRLTKAVEEVTEALEDMKYVTEVSHNLAETKEEIHIDLDREKTVDRGLVPAQVAQIVNNVTRGAFATQIVDEQEEVLSVIVQYDEKFRDSIDQLKAIKLQTPTGEAIPLSEIATVSIKDSPVTIQHENQAYAVAFDVKYESTESLGEMTERVNDTIDDLKLPDSIAMEYDGDRELFESAINDMLMAIGLAVVLVYIVMAAQFESFKYPFVIMFSVPLMIIGVALGLFITNTPMSVTAIIGILILVGIVVNNGIVLVDYINQRKRAGVPSYEAIVQSARDRVRPILMTALTTILGLVPLALGIGEGTEMNQPMGIAVIGGLITSTLLTLFVVPVIYSLFDRETRKRKRIKEADQQLPF